MLRFGETEILITGVLLAFGAAWLIFGYKPSEFIIVLTLTCLVGETVIEGVRIVCKRLDEISEVLRKSGLPKSGQL